MNLLKNEKDKQIHGIKVNDDGSIEVQILWIGRGEIKRYKLTFGTNIAHLQ